MLNRINLAVPVQIVFIWHLLYSLRTQSRTSCGALL
jgi:hypothetical protein